jgi:hypothetical protein
LGLDLLLLFLFPFPATAAVFKPVIPLGNGNGLGVVEEKIQDCAGGGQQLSLS